MNTATKTEINAANKTGNKYGENLMNTTKNKELILLKQLVKNSSKRCRSYWRFDWK